MTTGVWTYKEEPTIYCIRDQETTETVFSGTLNEFIEALSRYQAVVHSHTLRSMPIRTKNREAYMLRAESMRKIENVFNLSVWEDIPSTFVWIPICTELSEADMVTPFDRLTSQLEVALA